MRITDGHNRGLLGEKLDTKIGFSWLCFQQYNRVNESMTFGDIQGFIAGVDALEILFYREIVRNPDIDIIDVIKDDEGNETLGIVKKKYIVFIKELELKFNKDLRKIKGGKPHITSEKSPAIVNAAYVMSKEKLKILVLLMDKLGLLPGRKRTYSELHSGVFGPGFDADGPIADGEGTEADLSSK